MLTRVASSLGNDLERRLSQQDLAKYVLFAPDSYGCGWQLVFSRRLCAASQ